MLNIPLSKVVETYLYDNEGCLQSLDKFSLMRVIYDKFPPQLLLKCSRKTLKSTMLSNLISLNLIRYSYYKMLYVAPQEDTTKYFSHDYLVPRIESPPLKSIISGFRRNDVFSKILRDTESSVLLKYCSTDPKRTRGPATDHNFYDEVQDIDYDALAVVDETMGMSPFKRRSFAGTPLTTSNTIHKLWLKSTQNEWGLKCQTGGCGHWNFLIEANEPIAMIQKHGLSCSKCLKQLDNNTGKWISFNPNQYITGFHLAQPLIPHYNENPKEWSIIHRKIHDPQRLMLTNYNEVLGLSFDQGRKLLTREKILELCVLGEMSTALIRNRHKYLHITVGVDWGVNHVTSRTAVCAGGMREDGIYEVFFAKVYREQNYDWQIQQIAEMVNNLGAKCVADSGPDPYRGIKLMQLTGARNTQLARYEAGKLIQHFMIPPGSLDLTQARWCLNKSETLTFTFNQMKNGKVLFVRPEDWEDGISDILHEDIEAKEGALRQEIIYSHADSEPDDFLHALNFSLCQAHLLIRNPLLFCEVISSS